MANCDYTSSTAYQFYDSCSCSGSNVNVVGVYPQNKIERAIGCPINSNEWVQFSSPKILDIPSQKPNIEEVTSVHSFAEIISQKVIKTPEVQGYTDATGVFIPGDTISNAECTNLTGKKLIVQGLLRQRVVYTALVADQALHSASFSIPFSIFVIIDGDTPLSQKFKVTPYIEDIFACKLSERSVYSSGTIFINVSPIC